LGTALSATQLNATASYNGSPVAGTFTYTPGVGTMLGLGNGQQLAVSFAPSNTTLYNPASKTVTIDVVAGGGTTFYRALNLNGPALVIDGNNWEASASAPNFSYTTNQGVFSNQTIPLVPPTDANRSTMIRSSIWGHNLTLTLGAIPAGTYQVWLYVWEDNLPQVFSISMEGTVVQANYNSGAPGVWNKLGPFQATINDGAINVSVSRATGGGGYAQPSGLEIWSVQSGGNQPPVVANAIADQTATEGTAFNFTFAANTFSDPNAGTVLTYSASLTSGGALPAWLIFNGSTRNFSGTPGSGNVGTLNIRVTASDGAGGSVSDDFVLTVNPATKVTPVITWANPAAITLGAALSATQLNATASYNGSPVAGIFTYTPGVGTMLGLGNGQQLAVSFAPSNTTLYNPASKTVTIDVVAGGGTTFYRALNLNGPALVIDGNNWEASASAPNFSYTTNQGVFSNQTIPLVPPTDANRTTMIRSSIWGHNLTLTLGGVPAGTYQVWLYVWEDNLPQVFSISMEGTVVQANYNSGAPGVWNKLGPFQATINDGAINISVSRAIGGGGYAQPSGLEIWRVNQQAGGREAFVTGTETVEKEQGADGLQLSAYPNPFSRKVNIVFTGKESATTQLAMYDIRGVRVRVLFEGSLLAGKTEQLEVEAADAPDGVYVLQLVNGQFVKHFKLTITR